MTVAAQADDSAREALMAHAREILSRDRWSRERLLTFQRERLRRLLDHAVAHSPYYRETLGGDASERPLAELPPLTKAQLMTEFDRVVTDPSLRLAELQAFLGEAAPGESYRGEYRVFATSGATGQPGLFVYSEAEFAHWISVGLAAFARVGVTSETRLVAIGAPKDVHITRQLFAVFQAGRTGVPRLSATTPLPETIAELNRYQPEAVIGYASVLGLLADEQLHGSLAIKPRVVITSSEILTDETVRRIEEAWDTQPLDVYAATEAPPIAAASPDRVGMHVFEDSVVVEVVDENDVRVAPGVAGSKVLLTSLVSRAQPLIRYELSDAAVVARGADPSGRPYMRIERVEGRSDDVLFLPGRNGREVRVHPYRIRSPFSALLDVRQYQVVHERDGGIRIEIVPRPGADRGLDERVRAAVLSELEQVGAVPRSLTVVPVDAIERESGPAAKLKIVRSELSVEDPAASRP